MKCAKRLTSAQQRLVEENLAIVERVLRFDIRADSCVVGLGYEDLYQEGCVWLCNAALTFNPVRGCFASYARRVVQNGLVGYCRSLMEKQSRMTPLVEMESAALAALEVKHSVSCNTESAYLAVGAELSDKTMEEKGTYLHDKYTEIESLVKIGQYYREQAYGGYGLTQYRQDNAAMFDAYEQEYTDKTYTLFRFFWYVPHSSSHGRFVRPLLMTMI